jgi:putative PIN family toxin of toxin-antitoxin system
VPRAVVDTNVRVSALLNPNGAPARVLAALMVGRFALVTSEPLLAELSAVLVRPRIARPHGRGRADVDAFVALLRARAHLAPVTGEVRLCRDPDDDAVIGTALRGRADVLVTRDDDLKGAAEVTEILAAAGVPVLTVRHFLAMLEDTTAPGPSR